jgi:hypothetical protein
MADEPPKYVPVPLPYLRASLAHGLTHMAASDTLRPMA